MNLSSIRIARSTTPRALTLALAVALSATLAGCGSQAAEKSGPPPADVNVAPVVSKNVRQWDEFTGRIAAVETVELRPRVSGYIERIAFKERQEVRKGDLLFVIDQRPYQAQLAQAQAQLSKNLELDVDFGYTGSRIQDFNGTSAYVGQRLPSTPLYTLNIGPQYTHALPTGHVSARMDFAQFGRTLYQDFQNPNSNEVLTQLAYHTVNAQVAYGYKNWTLTVFGKNVFNEHYVNTAYSRYISQLIFGVTGDLIQPAVGATYGVEIRATFQ